MATRSKTQPKSNVVRPSEMPDALALNFDRELTDDVLRTLTSFDDVAAALGTAPDNAADFIGSGFELTDNKKQFVGVPLVLVKWRFSTGDYKNEDGWNTPFVSVHLMTATGGRFIITDGSTGICAQLISVTRQRGSNTGLYVNKGLRVSEYMYTDDKGIEQPAETYYLDA